MEMAMFYVFLCFCTFKNIILRGKRKSVLIIIILVVIAVIIYKKEKLNKYIIDI